MLYIKALLVVRERFFLNLPKGRFPIGRELSFIKIRILSVGIIVLLVLRIYEGDEENMGHFIIINNMGYCFFISLCLMEKDTIVDLLRRILDCVEVLKDVIVEDFAEVDDDIEEVHEPDTREDTYSRKRQRYQN
jgi:hypothetical protein